MESSTGENESHVNPQRGAAGDPKSPAKPLGLTIDDIEEYIQYTINRFKPSDGEELSLGIKSESKTEYPLDRVATFPAELQALVFRSLVEDFYPYVWLYRQSHFDGMAGSILADYCSPDAYEILKPIVEEVMLHHVKFNLCLYDRHSYANPHPGILEELTGLCRRMHQLVLTMHFSLEGVDTIGGRRSEQYSGTPPWTAAAISPLKAYFSDLQSLTFLLVVRNDVARDDLATIRSGDWLQNGRVFDPNFVRVFDPNIGRVIPDNHPLLDESIRDIVEASIDALKASGKPLGKHYFKLSMRRPNWKLHSHKIEIDDSQSAAQIIDTALESLHVPSPGELKYRV